MLVVAAVAVGLLGMLVFSGSGRSRQRAGADSTTTSSVASTVTTSTLATTTTTSTLKPLELGVPSGVSLAVWSNGGAVAIIELDTGVVHELSRSSPGPPPIGRAGGFVVSDGRLWSFRRPPYDGPAQPIATESNFLFPSNDPSRIWSVSSFSDVATVVEVDVVSGSAVRKFDIPPAAQPIGALGDGMAVDLFGGIYLAEPGSLRRLASGRPIATGGNKVLFVGCDRAGACSTQIVDAVTGALVTLEAAVPATGFLQASFAPDASTAALGIPSARAGTSPDLLIVDTRTGRTRSSVGVARPTPDFAPAPVWTADGAWLFWTAGPGVYALNVATDALLPIDVGDRRVDQIAVATP